MEGLGPVVLPSRSGSKSINENLWDGIVGVKGRYALGTTAVLSRCGHRSDAADLARRRGGWLCVPMGRGRGSITVYRLERPVGEADRE